MACSWLEQKVLYIGCNAELPALAAYLYCRAPDFRNPAYGYFRGWHCPLISPKHPALAVLNAPSVQAPPADHTALLQTREDSAARNCGPRVMRMYSAPMTMRSATLLRPASSSVRLAPLKDFREWTTPSIPITAALYLLVQRRAAKRDHLIQPVESSQGTAILMPANQFKSVFL